MTRKVLLLTCLLVMPLLPDMLMTAGAAQDIRPVAPASSVGLPAGPDTIAGVRAFPVVWIDDGSVLDPGGVAVSLSAWRWQDSASDGFPSASVALGLTPRVQMSAGITSRRSEKNDSGGAASILRGLLLSGRISVLDTTKAGSIGARLSVAPTLEILGPNAAREFSRASRLRWGAPLSLEISGAPVLLFASAGYFAGGTTFVGGGVGKHVTKRLGVSTSFSRAWTGATDATPQRIRNELAIGTAYALTPHLVVSGSIGQAIATRDADGPGTTVSVGLTLLRDAKSRKF